MKLEFLSYSEKEFKAEDVIRIYKDAGWWQERNEQDIDKMLKNEISVGAWSNYMLIGFTRAVTDGQFRAYVEDVVIHSDFQKTGIGTKLVSRLLAEISHIDVISLFCEEKLIPFYEKNNFKSSRSQFVLHRKG